MVQYFSNGNILTGDGGKGPNAGRGGDIGCRNLPTDSNSPSHSRITSDTGQARKGELPRDKHPQGSSANYQDFRDSTLRTGSGGSAISQNDKGGRGGDIACSNEGLIQQRFNRATLRTGNGSSHGADGGDIASRNRGHVDDDLSGRTERTEDGQKGRDMSLLSGKEQ